MSTILSFPIEGKPWPTVTVESVGAFHEELLQAVGVLTTESSTDPVRFVRQAHLATRRLLPIELHELALDFEYHGNGALLFTDLSVGPIPATPASPREVPTADTVLGKQAAVLVSLFGRLVGYRPESGGALIQNVLPTKADQHRQTSTGSRDELESHTEQCMNTLTRPDYIALACLRGDPNAATFLLSAREIQAALPAEAITLLRESRYFTGVDASFVDGGVSDEVRGPMPVLSGSPTDPSISYDQDMMFSPSPVHQRALDLITDIWRAHRHSVTLTPGELLIVDNSRAIHGRSAFRPQFDGGDRWLLRLQVLTNYPDSRFARKPGSPIIEPHGI